MLNAVLCAKLFEPICTTSAGSNNYFISINLLLVITLTDENAFTNTVFNKNIVTFVTEHHINVVVS